MWDSHKQTLVWKRHAGFKVILLPKHSLPLEWRTNNVAKAILHLFYRPEQEPKGLAF